MIPIIRVLVFHSPPGRTHLLNVGPQATHQVQRQGQGHDRGHSGQAEVTWGKKPQPFGNVAHLWLIYLVLP